MTCTATKWHCRVAPCVRDVEMLCMDDDDDDDDDDNDVYGHEKCGGYVAGSYGARRTTKCDGRMAVERRIPGGGTVAASPAPCSPARHPPREHATSPLRRCARND